MLFDPRPKFNRYELYDREEELNKLILAKAPVILILAPRRFGKTSLVNVFTSELQGRSVTVDCRAAFSDGDFSSASFTNFFLKLYNEFTEKNSSLKKIARKIKVQLKSVKVYGVELQLESSGAKNLCEIFVKLNEIAKASDSTFVITFDEAQMLRFLKRPGGIDFVSLLSFAYDNLHNLRFVLTGSEVGVLKDFLSLDDPSSPLFGRYILELTLPRFTEEMSIEFLRKGFSEIKLNVSDDFLEYAVSKLDGIVGWLTFFGYKCFSEGKANKEILNQVFLEAQQMVLKELQELFKHSEKYKYVLKSIAFDSSSWKAIKTGTELLSKSQMTDTSFNRILSNLVKMGYVIKKENGEYIIEDPILKEVGKNI